uniref:Uncharacterized protein n=1 Tax=Anguilla anguilla TaxID=7936 RepID=A0A0E9R7F7_ANGAN
MAVGLHFLGFMCYLHKRHLRNTMSTKCVP